MELLSNVRNSASSVASLFRERRLPWRLSQKLYRRRLEAARLFYDHAVLSTPPHITGEEALHFEIHVLLSTRHVGMTLWAVKSFLHHAERRYGVILHDDGTLSEQDIAKLEAHLVNVKVIRKADADRLIRKKIGHMPNCCDYRFSSTETTDHRGRTYNMRVFALRLFDFNLFSDATKTMVLDADVLFFKNPEEIVEWADDPADRNSLYSVEQYVAKRDSRYEVVGFERKSPPPTWANAGLLCFDRRGYDLEMIESWIGRDRHMMTQYATFEQRMYNLLLEHRGGATRLPDTYAFNYTDENIVATHFAIKHRFFENIPRIQQALG